jgi:hypothetical protein
VAMNGMNARTGDARRSLIERLAAVRIHAGIIRRALRRPEPLDRDAVVVQLDMIDHQVALATQLLDSNPSAPH